MHGPASVRRLGVITVTALIAGLLGSVPTWSSAAAVTTNEIYPVSANGSFNVQGHGWGHGHGMSQWGAQGGASLGKTADQITAFYYPGTAKATIANTPIRVLLQGAAGVATSVTSASGLRVTDLASEAHLTLPSGPTHWRSLTDAAGLHLQSWSTNAWTTVAIVGKTTFAGPLEFGGPAAVRLDLPGGTSRDYRGVIRSVRLTATSAASVNVVPLESYLRGVVPREASSSWDPAALQAQAIAARSYSAYKRAHAPGGQYFDICDSTACQVYAGAAVNSSSGSRTALEATTTDDAISATANVVRTYQGAPIFAEFSSSNGGWAKDGGQPYLIAQRDDWDGAVANSVHSWSASLTAAQLQARFPAIGTLKQLVVTGRDGNGEWGGRVTTVVLRGADSSGRATSVSTTGVGVEYANSWPASSNGLRSSWWSISESSVTSQSSAPALVQSPGVSTGSLTATLKNTGTSSWTARGLSLVVASPPGQADPLVGGSTTPGRYTGTASSIAPGASAEFSFALTGNGVRPGLQSRSYQLRQGSGPLFGAVVAWTVRVSAPALTAAQSGPPTTAGSQPPAAAGSPGPVLPDGRTVVVPVTGSTHLQLSYRNIGNVSWPTSGSVRLAVSGPRSSATSGSSPFAGPGWLTPTRPSALSGSTAVAPGKTGEFALTLYGNGRPLGVSQVSFEPIWEGQQWLDGAATSLTVVRVDPAVSLQATVESAPSSLALTTAPNGTDTAVLRMRNVGSSAWVVGSAGLRMSASPLSTSAWASPTAAPPLSANVSRPGQPKVFPGEVGEWRIPLSAYNKAAGTYALTAQPSTRTTYGPKVRFTVKVTKAILTGSLSRVSTGVTVPRAGSTTVSFDVKNTGNIAWPVGGLLRSCVGTSGNSPAQAPSWINARRPGTLSLDVTHPGATSVLPGDVGRFTLVLAGNHRPAGATSAAFTVGWDGWQALPSVRAVLSYRIV